MSEPIGVARLLESAKAKIGVVFYLLHDGTPERTAMAAEYLREAEECISEARLLLEREAA